MQIVRALRVGGPSPKWPSEEPALEWYEGAGKYPHSGPITRRRQLLSEVLLVQTPGAWLGYRDVANVDGRDVRDRTERVSRLFLSAEASRSDQLKRIAEESARFNLGTFPRTVNIPTLPLWFLRSGNHSRFQFTTQGTDRIGERGVSVVRYSETRRPTLVSTRTGEDVPISGRVWVDASSGAVLQTEIEMEVNPSAIGSARMRASLTTRYREERGFGVLVPDFMWEWYLHGYVRVREQRIVRALSEDIRATEGLARYGAYRRFDVSTDWKD